MKVEAVIILIFCSARIQAKLEDCSVEGITWSSDEQLLLIPLVKTVEECAIICERGEWLHITVACLVILQQILLFLKTFSYTYIVRTTYRFIKL